MKPEAFFRPIWVPSSGIFVQILIVNIDQSQRNTKIRKT